VKLGLAIGWRSADVLTLNRALRPLQKLKWHELILPQWHTAPHFARKLVPQAVTRVLLWSCMNDYLGLRFNKSSCSPKHCEIGTPESGSAHHVYERTDKCGAV
jgi:hypothetical protein